MTYNTGEPTNTVFADRYAVQAMSTLSPLNTLVVAAVGGYTSQQVLDHIPTVVLPILTAAKRNRVIYTVGVGTNDLTFGTTPAQIYANIQAICSAVKAVPGVEVVVLNKLPASFPGNSTANVNSLNALIAGGGACSYTIADVASDPDIGQPGDNLDPTYYLDGTHPTVTGYTVMATYYKTAIQSLGIQ